MENLTNSQPFEITEIRGKIIKRLEFKGETLVFIFADSTFYLLKMEKNATNKFAFSVQPEAEKVTESIVKAVTVLDTQIERSLFGNLGDRGTRFLLQIDTYKGTLMYALPTETRRVSYGGSSGRYKQPGYSYYDPETKSRQYGGYNPFEPDNGPDRWKSEETKAKEEYTRNAASSGYAAGRSMNDFADELRKKAAQTGKSMQEMLRDELKKRTDSMGYDPWKDLGFK